MFGAYSFGVRVQKRHGHGSHHARAEGYAHCSRLAAGIMRRLVCQSRSQTQARGFGAPPAGRRKWPGHALGGEHWQGLQCQDAVLTHVLLRRQASGRQQRSPTPRSSLSLAAPAPLSQARSSAGMPSPVSSQLPLCRTELENPRTFGTLLRADDVKPSLRESLNNVQSIADVQTTDAFGLFGAAKARPSSRSQRRCWQ